MMRHPSTHRPRLIGDQGRAWLRDAGNGLGLVIFLAAVWLTLSYLPAIREFLASLHFALVSGDQIVWPVR
jgi:hypothetical protein